MSEPDVALEGFREACKSLKREMLSKLRESEKNKTIPNWDEEWKAFPVLDPMKNMITSWPKGVIFIPNLLTLDEQLELTRRSVYEYSTSENSNLNSNPPSKRMKDNEDGANPESVKRLKIMKNEDDKEDSLTGLRWTTLGWHYDWSSRRYHDGWRSVFPEYLTKLSKTLRDRAQEQYGLVWKDFLPEAAIVNYYNQDTRMGPHRDDSELTFDHPILSISLGSDAIFCIETNPPNLQSFHESCINGNRAISSPSDSKTFAFRVRSGDVIVMDGNSRIALHGVACILPKTFRNENDLKDLKIQKFFETGRINVSLRQVESDGVFETFQTRDPHQEMILLKKKSKSESSSDVVESTKESPMQMTV